MSDMTHYIAQGPPDGSRELTLCGLICHPNLQLVVTRPPTHIKAFKRELEMMRERTMPVVHTRCFYAALMAADIPLFELSSITTKDNPNALDLDPDDEDLGVEPYQE